MTTGCLTGQLCMIGKQLVHEFLFVKMHAKKHDEIKCLSMKKVN
jgi:hypothetical protein